MRSRLSEGKSRFWSTSTRLSRVTRMLRRRDCWLWIESLFELYKSLPTFISQRPAFNACDSGSFDRDMNLAAIDGERRHFQFSHKLHCPFLPQFTDSKILVLCLSSSSCIVSGRKGFAILFIFSTNSVNNHSCNHNFQHITTLCYANFMLTC